MATAEWQRQFSAEVSRHFNTLTGLDANGLDLRVAGARKSPNRNRIDDARLKIFLGDGMNELSLGSLQPDILGNRPRMVGGNIVPTRIGILPGSPNETQQNGYLGVLSGIHQDWQKLEPMQRAMNGGANGLSYAAAGVAMAMAGSINANTGMIDSTSMNEALGKFFAPFQSSTGQGAASGGYNEMASSFVVAPSSRHINEHKHRSEDMLLSTMNSPESGYSSGRYVDANQYSAVAGIFNAAGAMFSESKPGKIHSTERRTLRPRLSLGDGPKNMNVWGQTEQEVPESLAGPGQSVIPTFRGTGYSVGRNSLILAFGAGNSFADKLGLGQGRGIGSTNTMQQGAAAEARYATYELPVSADLTTARLHQNSVPGRFVDKVAVNFRKAAGRLMGGNNEKVVSFGDGSRSVDAPNSGFILRQQKNGEFLVGDSRSAAKQFSSLLLRGGVLDVMENRKSIQYNEDTLAAEIGATGRSGGLSNGLRKAIRKQWADSANPFGQMGLILPGDESINRGKGHHTNQLVFEERGIGPGYSQKSGFTKLGLAYDRRVGNLPNDTIVAYAGDVNKGPGLLAARVAFHHEALAADPVYQGLLSSWQDEYQSLTRPGLRSPEGLAPLLESFHQRVQTQLFPILDALDQQTLGKYGRKQRREIDRMIGEGAKPIFARLAPPSTEFAASTRMTVADFRKGVEAGVINDAQQQAYLDELANSPHMRAMRAYSEMTDTRSGTMASIIPAAGSVPILEHGLDASIANDSYSHPLDRYDAIVKELREIDKAAGRTGKNKAPRLADATTIGIRSGNDIVYVPGPAGMSLVKERKLSMTAWANQLASGGELDIIDKMVPQIKKDLLETTSTDESVKELGKAKVPGLFNTYTSNPELEPSQIRFGREWLEQMERRSGGRLAGKQAKVIAAGVTVPTDIGDINALRYPALQAAVPLTAILDPGHRGMAEVHPYFELINVGDADLDPVAFFFGGLRGKKGLSDTDRAERNLAVTRRAFGTLAAIGGKDATLAYLASNPQNGRRDQEYLDDVLKGPNAFNPRIGGKEQNVIVERRKNPGGTIDDQLRSHLGMVTTQDVRNAPDNKEAMGIYNLVEATKHNMMSGAIDAAFGQNLGEITRLSGMKTSDQMKLGLSAWYQHALDMLKMPSSLSSKNGLYERFQYAALGAAQSQGLGTMVSNVASSMIMSRDTNSPEGTGWAHSEEEIAALTTGAVMDKNGKLDIGGTATAMQKMVKAIQRQRAGVQGANDEVSSLTGANSTIGRTLGESVAIGYAQKLRNGDIRENPNAPGQFEMRMQRQGKRAKDGTMTYESTWVPVSDTLKGIVDSHQDNSNTQLLRHAQGGVKEALASMGSVLGGKTGSDLQAIASTLPASGANRPATPDVVVGGNGGNVSAPAKTVSTNAPASDLSIMSVKKPTPIDPSLGRVISYDAETVFDNRSGIKEKHKVEPGAWEASAVEIVAGQVGNGKTARFGIGWWQEKVLKTASSLARIVDNFNPGGVANAGATTEDNPFMTLSRAKKHNRLTPDEERIVMSQGSPDDASKFLQGEVAGNWSQGHNILGYDAKLFKVDTSKAIDTLVTEQILSDDKNTKGKKLVNVAQKYGMNVTEDSLHGSLIDSKTSGEVMMRQAESVAGFSDSELQWLSEQNYESKDSNHPGVKGFGKAAQNFFKYARYHKNLKGIKDAPEDERKAKLGTIMASMKGASAGQQTANAVTAMSQGTMPPVGGGGSSGGGGGGNGNIPSASSSGGGSFPPGFMKQLNSIASSIGTAAFQMSDLVGLQRENAVKALRRNEAVWGTSDQLAGNLVGLANPGLSGSPAAQGPNGEMRGTILAKYTSAMEVLNNPMSSAAARETAANRLQTIRFGATVQGYLGTLDNAPGVTHGVIQSADSNLMGQIRAGRQAAKEMREGQGPAYDEHMRAKTDAAGRMGAGEFRTGVNRISDILTGKTDPKTGAVTPADKEGKSFGFDKLGEAHENYVKAVKRLTATVNTVRAKIESGEKLSPEEKHDLKEAMVGESVSRKQYSRAERIAKDALGVHPGGGKVAAMALGLHQERELQDIQDEADESRGIASRATGGGSRGSPTGAKNLKWSRLMSGFFMFQIAREWRMTMAPAIASTQQEVAERTQLGSLLDNWQTQRTPLSQTYGAGFRAVQQWQAAGAQLESHRYSMGSGLAAGAAYAIGGRPQDVMANPWIGGASTAGGMGLAFGLGTAMAMNTIGIGAATAGPVGLAIGLGAATIGGLSYVAGHTGDTTKRTSEIMAGYYQGQSQAAIRTNNAVAMAQMGTDLRDIKGVDLRGGQLVNLSLQEQIASDYGDHYEPTALPQTSWERMLGLQPRETRSTSRVKDRTIPGGSILAQRVGALAKTTVAPGQPANSFNRIWGNNGIFDDDTATKILAAGYASGITDPEGAQRDLFEQRFVAPYGAGRTLDEATSAAVAVGTMMEPWSAFPAAVRNQFTQHMSYSEQQQQNLAWQRRGGESQISRYVSMGFGQSRAINMAQMNAFVYGADTASMYRQSQAQAAGDAFLNLGIDKDRVAQLENTMQNPLRQNITPQEMSAGLSFLAGDRNLQARAYQQGSMLPGANWRGAVSTDITTGGGPIGRNSLFGMTKNMLTESSFVRELGGSRLGAGWTTQTIRADLNQNLQLPYGLQWTDEDVQAAQGESFGGLYGQAGIQELYARKAYASQLASIGVQGEKLKLSRQFELNVTRPQRDFQLALQGATQFGGTVGGYQFTGAFNFQEQQLGFEQRSLSIQKARSDIQFGWQGFDLNKQHGRAQIGFGWSEQEAQLGRQGQLLGRGMQQYEFGFQQTSLELGHKYFGEDWGLSQQKRFLSFGWQMEDSERNIRRSTGFEKQQLIRERGRAVEMFGLDQTQAGREKSREEEKFKREEEHLKKQMDQFKKNAALEDQRWAIEQDRLIKQRDWERQDFDTEMSRLGIKKSWADEDFAREQEALDRKKQQFEDDRKAAEMSYAKEQERWAKEKEFSDAQYELSLKELGVQAQQIANAEELRVKMLEFEKQREQADMENARRMEQYLNLFFEGLMQKVGKEWNDLFKFGPNLPGKTNTGTGGAGSGVGTGQGNTTGSTTGSSGAPPIPTRGKTQDTVSTTKTVHAPAQNNNITVSGSQAVQIVLDGKVVAETVIKLAGPALYRDSRRTLGIG